MVQVWKTSSACLITSHRSRDLQVINGEIDEKFFAILDARKQTGVTLDLGKWAYMLPVIKLTKCYTEGTPEGHASAGAEIPRLLINIFDRQSVQ